MPQGGGFVSKLRIGRREHDALEAERRIAPQPIGGGTLKHEERDRHGIRFATDLRHEVAKPAHGGHDVRPAIRPDAPRVDRAPLISVFCRMTNTEGPRVTQRDRHATAYRLRINPGWAEAVPLS